MSPTLGVLASDALDGNVRATTAAELLQLGNHGSLVGNAKAELLVINQGELVLVLRRPTRLNERQTRLRIDEDDLLRALHGSVHAGHLADRSGTEDGHLIIGINSRILDGVVTRAQHIRQVQRLLIRNTIRDLQQVVIADGHADILGLATSKAAGEVRVAKDTGAGTAVHGLRGSVGVGLLALRRQLLLAEEAVSAADLEGGDIALALLDLLDAGTCLDGHTAELVAEDVALLHLNHGAVKKMQIRTANGAACHLEDDIVVLQNLGHGHLAW